MSGDLSLQFEGSTDESDVRGEISLVSLCDFDWTLMDFLAFPEEKEFVSTFFSYMEGTWRIGCLLSIQWVHLRLEKVHSNSALRVEYRLGIRRHGGGDYASRTEVEIFKEDGEVWKTDFLVPMSNLLRDSDLVAPGGKINFFCTFRPRGDADYRSPQSPEAEKDVKVTAVQEVCYSGDSEISVSSTKEDAAKDEKLTAVQEDSHGRDSLIPVSSSKREEDKDVKVTAAQEVSHGDDSVISVSSGKIDAAKDVKGTAAQEDSHGGDSVISVPSSKIGTDKVAQDLKAAFLNGDMCDLTIKLLNKEFRAHKFILSLRCPVFKAMLTHDTVERETRVITITDVEPEIFRVLLMFLYSGKLENVSNENVTKFYIIADKYQVDEMKSECMKFIMTNMSVETFGDVLSLALAYNNRELLESATNYFAKNMKRIIETVKWQNFLEKQPAEANDFMKRAVNQPSQ